MPHCDCDCSLSETKKALTKQKACYSEPHLCIDILHSLRVLTVLLLQILFFSFTFKSQRVNLTAVLAQHTAAFCGSSAQ